MTFGHGRKSGLSGRVLHVLVAGVDGARGGWIVAYAEVSGGELDGAEGPGAQGPNAEVGGPAAAGAQVHLRAVEFVRTLEEVLAQKCSVAAVDIPIGLPEVGPRDCDLQARALLRPYGSRVFPAPVRAALPHTDDYIAACDAARAASGRALSRQAWHLLPKIAEAAALADDAPLRECHPEVAFALMNGSVVAERKKTAAGAGIRRRLLARAWNLGAQWIPPRLPGAPDDVLDAVACAWSAARIATGRALVLGDDEATISA